MGEPLLELYKIEDSISRFDRSGIAVRCSQLLRLTSVKFTRFCTIRALITKKKLVSVHFKIHLKEEKDYMCSD
jgi:hypothetical protein